MNIKNEIENISIETVVDRKELYLIVDILSQNNAVLLTGIAGAGKTTLANLFLYKYKDNYHDTLQYSYSQFINPKKEIGELINKLNEQNKKSLIIVDDVDENGLTVFSNFYDSLNKNWYLILISRFVIQDFRIPIIFIGGLNLQEAHELLKKRLKRYYKNLDRPEIDELLNFVGKNPLAIELISRCYEQQSFKSFKELRNKLVHNLYFTLDIARKPIEIYLDSNNENQIKSIYKKVIEFIKDNELTIEKELPHEDGSWFKRIFVKAKEATQSEGLKEKFSEAEYCVKLHTITKCQSEIDKNQAEAVSKIIESIKEIPNAAIKLGSILIVKITLLDIATIAVKNLSLKEMLTLEKTPSLLKIPAELLEKLSGMNKELD